MTDDSGLVVTRYLLERGAEQDPEQVFVTFQDSNDWSHPLRLELQAKPLVDDPKLVATTSDGMERCYVWTITGPATRRPRSDLGPVASSRAGRAPPGIVLV